MKKIIIIILILFSIGTYSQTNKNDSLRFNKLEKQIKALQDSIQSIKQDETSLYVLKRDILKTKDNTLKLREYYESEHDSLFAEFLKHGYSILSIVLFFIITGLGYKDFKSKYEQKIHNKVKAEVDELVPQKVSEITQTKIDILKKEYRQFEKHTKYREKAKILIINEGTPVPEGFDKVMSLFKDADGSEIDRLSIPKLSLLKDYYDTFSEYDILVIENHVIKEWIIDNRYKTLLYKNLENDIDKITKLKLDENEKLIQLTKLNKKLREEKERIIESAKNNNKHLVDLADNICHSTAIVYKGLGQFPIQAVKDDSVHMITFANAFSQLYGNILSMLKFINELKK